MRLAYRPELDGLRAVAILMVIADHAVGVTLGWTNSLIYGLGVAGVTAFFTLSGYLITALLLDERRSVGAINLRAFYIRRFARLGPALVALLVFVTIAGAMGLWREAWHDELVVTIGYVANWAQAMHEESGPLAHTWSLAVEEQFYLLWPTVLVVIPRRAPTVAVATLTIGLALYAVLPPKVAYYATPTNAEALMAGALVALWTIRLPQRGASGGLALVLAGAVAAPLAALGAAILIASESRVLSRLAVVGRRAYSLYLWNWPLVLLLGPAGTPLTFVAGEASYRFIERPIRDWVRRLLAHDRGHGPDASLERANGLRGRARGEAGDRVAGRSIGLDQGAL